MPNKGTTLYLKPTEVTFNITTPVSAMPAMVAATPNPPAIPKPTASTQSTYCVMCSALGKPCPMFTLPTLTFSLEHSDWSDVEEDWDDEKQKVKERKEKEQKEN